MTQIDLVPKDRDPEAAIESTVAELGLAISSKGTLRKFNGSVHWHIKRPGESGTLEATWWPKTGQFWLSVHANRGANWIEEAIAKIKASPHFVQAV